jgi:lipid-binding SYLF domain-containing protein
MKTRKHFPLRSSFLVFVMIGLFFVGTRTTPVFADDATDASQLVTRAQLSFEGFMTAGEMEPFRSLMTNARGVFIAPQILKGAFVFGVSGGSGILLARDPLSGKWAGPAFYTIGGLSFGLQAGGEASELILLAMTERGVNALLSDSVRLGADIGIAVGPVGMGAKAATANLSADIIAFARSKGLYGGISVEGAVVKTRNDWNDAYYGTITNAKDILILRKVHNPQTDQLIGMVTKAAGD